MSANRERLDLFEQWSAHYDDTVYGDGEGDFPFAGYERVLDAMVRFVLGESGKIPSSGIKDGLNNRPRMLDVGIGTGNLAAKFSGMDWDVWGVDFSREMLRRAGERLSGARLIEADLLKPLPETLHIPFDYIVSAYVFHEFDPLTRMNLLQSMAKTSLAPGGAFVIGDIAFPTEGKREEARIYWQDEWDEDEFYWAADEALIGFEELGWTAAYKQISVCAGVFVVKPGS